MKDYIYEAKKHGLTIYSPSYKSDYIKGYTLNRENNYVLIKYADGRLENKEIEENTISELNDSMKRTFDFYCEKIFPKVKEQIGWKGGIVGLDLINASLNLSLQNYFSGFCWLTCAALYYIQIHAPLKLQRELKLVSWIYDNKDKVNEVIKEEVDSKIEKPEITATTNNLPTLEYPTSLVPYSEEMYEEGINLNNIDSLDNKTLRKLKRKVLKKERGK
ncbi:MAG: hypothetical protein IJN90_04280 [Bacilli bacterium]|nr:hypothetical protein [Bacilli bacterium]